MFSYTCENAAVESTAIDYKVISGLALSAWQLQHRARTVGCGYSLITGNPCLLWQQSSVVSFNSDIYQMSSNRVDVKEPFLKPKCIRSTERYMCVVRHKRADTLGLDFKAMMSSVSKKKGSHWELWQHYAKWSPMSFSWVNIDLSPSLCLSSLGASLGVNMCDVSSSDATKHSHCPTLAFTRSCKLPLRIGPAWTQDNQQQMC